LFSSSDLRFAERKFRDAHLKRTSGRLALWLRSSAHRAAVELGNAASLRVLEKLGFAVIAAKRGLRSFHHFELANPSGNR
jgi:hypothetical protein